MNKKYIAVFCVLILMVSVFAACKKDDLEKTGEVGGTNSSEISTEENGEQYVTNVDGDKIPVTTDAKGNYDKIEDLVTQTTTKRDSQNSNAGTTNGGNESTGTTATTAPASTTTTTTTIPELTTTPTNTTSTTTSATTSSTETGSDEKTLEKGDVNGDGKIDISDATMVLMIYAYSVPNLSILIIFLC